MDAVTFLIQSTFNSIHSEYISRVHQTVACRPDLRRQIGFWPASLSVFYHWFRVLEGADRSNLILKLADCLKHRTMTSLNRYRDYIDTSTKEGIVLYDNAITNFTSPLEAGNGIKLVPKDGPRLIETLNKLANTFGYDYMMKNVPTR